MCTMDDLSSRSTPKTTTISLSGSLHTIASEVVPEVRILLVRQICESIQMPQLVTLTLLITVIGRMRRFQSRLSLVSITANQQEPKDDKEYVEENVETEMRCKPFLITR